MIAHLQWIRNSAPAKDKKKIDEAIKAVAKSLSSKYWANANHPSDKDGKKVFDEEKKAAEKLYEIRATTPAVVNDINRLVAIDRGLAQQEINETVIPGSGNAKEIAAAEKELAARQRRDGQG